MSLYDWHYRRTTRTWLEERQQAMEWHDRVREVWRAYVNATRPQIKVHSGLTEEVNQHLGDAAQAETSGYEILEVLDWVQQAIDERRARYESQPGAANGTDASGPLHDAAGGQDGE
jgi:hypothetical protein